METRKLTFVAINTALIIVLTILNHIVPIRMPQGGSIEIYLIPLFLIAYKTNFKTTISAAIIVTLLTQFFGILYFISIFQFFMDYILALSVIGVFSYFKTKIYFGIIITMFLKYLVHVASGILFYSAYANGQAVIIYSLIYNITYVLPTTIVILLTLPIILKKIKLAK